MADVFVAFVREDQAFAEALAIALQDAGLIVSRSASVMDAIGACPAVVVLWTPASSRSRLFLDAADQAFRSGKMVLARLGGAPAPAEYNAALQHAFQSWSGDPDQPELAVVIAHVRRMVEFARGRAAVGGGAGVVHPFPGPSARPAPPPAPAPSAHPTDGRMMEEVAFWKQVDSRGDAASYHTYLERYGSAGVFADMATARLRALAPPPMQPPPMQAPPMASPPYGGPSYTFRPPPPPVTQAPPRPPERTYDAPPPMARAPAEPGPGDRLTPGRLAFDRAPPFDQPPARERPAWRETQAAPPPPKGGAGIGAVIFLLILGGLAAGGWFVYNGGSFTPIPPREPPSPRMVAPIQDGPIQAPSMAPDPGPRAGARDPAPGSSAEPTTNPPSKSPPTGRSATSGPSVSPSTARAPSSSRATEDPANRAYVPPPPAPPPVPTRSEAQDSLLRELEEVQGGDRPPPSTAPPR